MKKFLLIIAVLFSTVSFSQKGKDKEAPEVTNVTAYANTNYAVVQADVTDDLDIFGKSNVFQVIFQIDPVGKTWPGDNRKNVAHWQAVDFYKSGTYTFTPDDLDLAPGTHILRVTAYDFARNETTVEISFTVQ